MSDNPRAAFADLLDRMLDRGVYLQADVIVTVAGVPLLGLSLRALLGGMETLLSYGIFRDWDAAIRMEKSDSVDPPLLESPAALWRPVFADRRWIRGTLAIDHQGVRMRDEAGAQCLDLPFSQVEVVTLCEGPTEPPRAAGCLKFQVDQQEVWLYVYHLRSLVSALSARGIAVAQPGSH